MMRRLQNGLATTTRVKKPSSEAGAAEGKRAIATPLRRSQPRHWG